MSELMKCFSFTGCRHDFQLRHRSARCAIGYPN